MLMLLSINSYASNIELPKESYRIDNEKRIIVCNADLSKLAFDDQPVKFKIDNNDYNIIDNVKSLKIGVRYIIALDQGFVRYSIYFTELPLIFISTDDAIVDSPKVFSKITIVENDGKVLESNAGIEYRGATSQNYPKKSFEIEFWNDKIGDDTKDVTLFNLREDKDWNLQAMYNEPLKMANSVAWEIWDNIGVLYYQDKEPKAKSGTGSNYVEVFVNDSYQGIFAISEKIDRKQLRLKKNTDTETLGELYKGDGWEVTTYYELPDFDNTSETWGGYEFKYPKSGRDWSNLYNLHDFVMNSDDETFFSQYKDKYDHNNLTDYFIFLNLLRATDNSGKNVYTAKYDKDGKYFFIPWDLDGVLGRIWDGSIENITDDLLSNGLYDRLWQDTKEDGFRSGLKKRWTSLRSDFVTVDNLMQLLINNYSYLKVNAAYERDQIANSGSTISSEYEEFAFIREWITKRIAYLDETFGLEFPTPTSEESGDKTNGKFQFYPNPAKNQIYFINKNEPSENTFLDIDIYTVTGRKIKTVSQTPLNQSLFIGNIPDGNYILNIKSNSGIKQSFKLIIDK